MTNPEGMELFNFKKYTKLDMHCKMHIDSARNWVLILEWVDLCHVPWYKILDVIQTTSFFCIRLDDQQVKIDHYENLGTKKLHMHTLQAKATLGSMLDNIADQMPHISKTWENGENVVLMSQLASWKWMNTIPQINIVNGEVGLKKASIFGF